MIELTRGDIVQAEAEALVNTVNCVGIMGRGIALQFRKAFPDNYRAYQAVCNRHELRPGTVLVHNLGRLQPPYYIINFPTKRHWKGNSRMEDIEAGLQALIEEVRHLGIRSIAVPPLGCGLGGLDWRQVRPRIEAAFSALPEVRVLLYEPAGAPEAKAMVREARQSYMTEGRAALVGLMDRYLAAVMDPFVSLLEIHKLMYFLQESGENLRLRYQKGIYGPYAQNLRHVLNEMEGHFINGYGDATDKPDKQIELLPGAREQAEVVLADYPDTRERFARVADLIEGFETPFGMEMLATVHWVATREAARTLESATAKTYAWGRRKRMFKVEHLGIAWGVLTDKGWLSIESDMA